MTRVTKAFGYPAMISLKESVRGNYRGARAITITISVTYTATEVVVRNDGDHDGISTPVDRSTR